MVRQFNLINENNEKFSLMDIQNNCLLTDPSGLGLLYTTSYERLGSTFVENLRRIEQNRIAGIVNFLNYENYNKFANYVTKSKSLKLEYIIDLGTPQTFYREISLRELTKTEIQTNGVMSESITIECLSLWYQEDETDYSFGDQDIIWDFYWDPIFGDYKSRSIIVDNDGQIDATFKVTIANYVRYPKIEVLVNGEVVNSLQFPFILQDGERIEYSSKQNDTYIRKIGTDGTITNLFNSSYIDINNTNIFTLPMGESVLNVSAENDIITGNVSIFKRYKVV